MDPVLISVSLKAPAAVPVPVPPVAPLYVAFHVTETVAKEPSGIEKDSSLQVWTLYTGETTGFSSTLIAKVRGVLL